MTLMLPGTAYSAVDRPISAFEDLILIVLDDPRPARLRQGSQRKYGGPIAYDKDPVLRRHAKRIANKYNQDVIFEWPLRSLAVHCLVVKRPDPETLRRIQADHRVAWVQPFNTHLVQRTPKTHPISKHAVSNLLPVPGNAMGVRISIIDTGADLSHPDLPRKSVVYKDLVDDLIPVKEKGRGFDEAHGTSVLGLIAAQPAPDSPIDPGMASGADIQHLRGCWEENLVGKCSTLTLALALEAAIQYRPAVINLSLTGPTDRVLDALLEKLAERGTTVVAAHDEQREHGQRFPRPAAHVVYVKAGESLGLHNTDTRTFIAPGQVLSTSPMASYQLFTGHSAAVPHLTATIARIKAQQKPDHDALWHQLESAIQN